MNEWLLYVIMGMLVLTTLIIAIHPLNKQKSIRIVFIPVIIIFLTVGYWQWGGLSAWQEHVEHVSKTEQVQALLQSKDGPARLIAKMKAQLNKEPGSSKGWYLLGRIYSSQNKWQDAYDAFEHAYTLHPDDEQIAVNYAQSIWQINNQQFDNEVHRLFNIVLQNNPKQPDALAMLAMEAFMHHDYKQAIDYWQRLLKLAPESSDDAKAILKAIAKAQQGLTANP